MTNKDPQLQVLLVEDNQGDAFLVQEAARESAPALQINVANDGDQALDILRGSNPAEKSTDIVILDLNMPGRNGLSVLSEIRSDSDLKLLPVLILTSSRSSKDVVAAYQLRANAFLTKPSELGELGLLLRSISDFWTRNINAPLIFMPEPPPAG